MAEHLGVTEGVGYLTPQDELDEIELGERVIDDFLNWRVVLAYVPESQPDLTVRSLVATVARDLRDRHGWSPPLIPREWWSPSAGEYPYAVAEAEPVTRGPGCDNPRWEAGDV